MEGRPCRINRTGCFDSEYFVNPPASTRVSFDVARNASSFTSKSVNIDCNFGRLSSFLKENIHHVRNAIPQARISTVQSSWKQPVQTWSWGDDRTCWVRGDDCTLPSLLDGVTTRMVTEARTTATRSASQKRRVPSETRLVVCAAAPASCEVCPPRSSSPPGATACAECAGTRWMSGGSRFRCERCRVPVVSTRIFSQQRRDDGVLGV